MMHLTAFHGARAATVIVGLSFLSVGPAVAAVVLTNADGVIRNSLCVGLDCADAEAFSFSTIRLKENNTRIDFIDTSVGSFPSRDWRLEANSSASSGANYFAIKDMGDSSTGGEGGTALLTVTAGAPANSIFVASSGRVGFRTSTPVIDLHVATGNTPGLRLEQNGSSGFSPQTWDIAGNETNFFVRDATNGSTLPFRIRPGAPGNSIFVDPSGKIGFGTASPEVNVHVASAGTTSLQIEATGGTTPGKWNLGTNNTNGSFFVSDRVNSTIPLRIVPGAPNNSFAILSDGTIRIAGLPNCPGLQTNASGNLACTAGPSPPRGLVSSLVPTAVRRAGVSGSITSAPLTGAAGAGTSDGSSSGSSGATSESCGPGDMAGRWKLVGTNIEKFGVNSVLWCEVQLTQAHGRSKISYSISGDCRNHAPGVATPERFTVDGKGSLTETAACTMGGSFRIKQRSAVIATANILEGSIEGPAGKKSRVIALSRMALGRTSAIQTFVLQR